MTPKRNNGQTARAWFSSTGAYLEVRWDRPKVGVADSAVCSPSPSPLCIPSTAVSCVMAQAGLDRIRKYTHTLFDCNAFIFDAG
jgi:hypothetical protein